MTGFDAPMVVERLPLIHEYIKVYDGALLKFECDDLIQEFLDLNPPNQPYSSIHVQQVLQMVPDNKKALWAKLDQKIYESLNGFFEMYKGHFNTFPKLTPVVDSGYFLHRLKKGKEYTEQLEVHNIETSKKLLVAHLFLNDVEGGELHFFNQNLRIKPAAGRLVLFPASWIFQHRGSKAVQDRYFLTSYFMMNA